MRPVLQVWNMGLLLINLDDELPNDFLSFLLFFARMSIVESIPEGLVFNDSTAITHLSTYKAWLGLIQLAQHEIDIGSYYWSLQDTEFDDPTAIQAREYLLEWLYLHTALIFIVSTV